MTIINYTLLAESVIWCIKATK